MASLSKRHQARNEQALQDLLRSVPGNDRCADCQTRNPGWASWSLGIFLCMRCGSLHRKLGTHISKVKSLSMDSWAAEQVEVMRQNGNVKSNQKFNPKNVKPPVPLDADEIDSAMERFIRQKYEQKAFLEGAPRPPARVDTGPNVRGIDEGDESPPPTPAKDLPPKSGSGKLFGFMKRDKNKAGRKSSASAVPGRSMSATFGVSDDGLEWKLIQLREMGFQDDSRNSSILKGVNGDLERAIESLIRLGEGSGPSSRQAARVSTPQESSRKNTPTALTIRKDEAAAGASASGQTSAPAKQAPTLERSTDPNDPTSDSFWDSIAPTSAPAQPQQSLVGGFQGLQLQQQPHSAQAPLFPNATGGHPSYLDAQSQAQMQMSMTQSVPQLPPQHNPYAQAGYNPYMTGNTGQASPGSNPFMQAQQTSFNPFLQQQQQQQQQNIPQMQYGGPQATGLSYQQSMATGQISPQQQPNTQPTGMHQQIFHQQPLQQTSFFQPQQQQQHQQQEQQQQQPWANPATQGFSSYSPQNPYAQFAPPQQPGMLPQATGRIDKSAILALYNQPQLAPQAQQQQVPASPSAGSGTTSPSTATGPASPGLSGPGGRGAPGTIAPPQRSVTMPLSATMPGIGSRNPFAKGNPAPVSQEESGRQSPDAFANLSARFVR